MPVVPTLRMERGLWKTGHGHVVGVDECGVGSLCGPVVAACCLLPQRCRQIKGVRDSKTLSRTQRENLAATIRSAYRTCIGAATVAEIDDLNIYHATHLAMQRALRKLATYDHVLVDGRAIADFENVIGPYTPIVGGDGSSYAIACASIIAKVARDRLLQRMARSHPQYGWERNAGYSTREHLDAIVEHGLTPHHRLSFAPAKRVTENDQLEFAELTGSALVLIPQT